MLKLDKKIDEIRNYNPLIFIVLITMCEPMIVL